MAEGSSSDWIRPGVRVSIKDKNLEGTVRFVGNTDFAPGKWVGVELDDPKGKNNGVVKGKTYFECRDQHGLFVRSTQLESIGDPSTPLSSIPLPKSVVKRSSSGNKSPTTGRRSPLVGSPATKKSPKSSKTDPTQSHSTTHKPAPPTSQNPLKEEKEEVIEKPASFAPPPTISVSGASEEVRDLQQKLTILQQKRSEDKTKIKELEKFRLQFQQMIEYKTKWTESQTELQQQLKQTRKEAREFQLQKEQIEEELRELSDAVEIATLDKEMAEEKCEGLQAENEALKERIQELSMDLEILQNEISESGYEGAAASGQLKQLEQQNARLKDALVRLRDVSNEEKAEHQLVVKELEKQTQSLALVREQKNRLDEELKAADELITSLKEQVDVAMGAEDMVEKLTDKNLQLEEELAQLTETVSDLEDLRELSEQQEEIRIEVEHDLREELDLNMNNIRQMERRLEASQETIVDQQQTIEKFRELVRQLQADLAELRRQPKGEEEQTLPPVAPDTMLKQLKSSVVQAYSRTIDYELRKLETKQLSDMINHLKSFLPSSFLVSGGDYDALNVIMLLPRLVFKADLIIDQLRQQTAMDDALSSPSSLKNNAKKDLLTYVAFLIYKLSSLQLLANRTIRALYECDVQTYRQIGGLRDDLALHERALDILIELLKKEQLDESVPLNGIEKAINHFESLLQSRLTLVPKCGQMDLFQDQVKVVSGSCDYCSLEMIRLQAFTKDGAGFMTQLKELETFNNDIRQNCRRARRRLPTPQSGKIVVCPTELFPTVISHQRLIVTNFRALHNKVYETAQGLSEGETLSNRELETFLQEVSQVVLQEVWITEERSSEELIHICLSKTAKSLEQFLNDLQDGTYDAPDPKIKVTPPLSVRAQAVKAELSDTEGLKYKIEEKNNEIIELKKSIKMKSQEVGEVNVKVGLLEKKLEIADTECVRKVEEEKMETERIKTIMDQQEEKFNKAIIVLQRDIETLEEERDTLKQKLDNQSKTHIPADISSTRRSMSLSGRQALAALISRSPVTPQRSQTVTPSVQNSIPTLSENGQEQETIISNSPLLLAQIDSLRKALNFSQDENICLKAQMAKAKLASLPSLNIPKRLLATNKQQDDEQDISNRTDLEKSVLKRTNGLLQDLSTVLRQTYIVDITKKENSASSSRDVLAQQLSSLVELKKKADKLKEDTMQVLATTHPGGLVLSRLRPFVSPQFTKVLSEANTPSQLLARLHLPCPQEIVTSSVKGSNQKLILSANQFQALHKLVIT